jgi:UDP-glucose 4-epimerase
MSVDALVTGGSGFIGSALVGALRRSGAEVRVADLRPFPDPDVPAVVGDLLDADVRAAALDGGPATVYHLAARTSVLQSKKDPLGVYRVNVEMTQHLLEDARRAGSGSFVLSSTNAVVGETGGALIDEDTPLHPLTPYGATKAAGEMLCSAYRSSFGLEASAVRLTNVYGPGMGAKDTFVVRLLRAAATGEPVTIYGDGLQERDYVFVDDAIAGLQLGARSGERTLVIGSGASTTVHGVRAIASEVVGREIPHTSVEAPEGEMRAVRVDVAHARRAGYEPEVDLREGVARTWDALRDVLGPRTVPAGR